MQIEQALYASRDATGYAFLARSPGFRDDWLSEAERLCTEFGERPAGVTCPDGLFARPFGARRVAIVSVTDRGADDSGRPAALAFRILVLPTALYAELGGDPFYVAEQCPPDFNAQGELPTLTWSAGPPPRRSVARLRKVLDVPNSAVLLGGAQALLDGGRLVFERREPAGDLVRSLWTLLPTNSRSSLWPATFVFANASHFQVAVVPRSDDPALAAYVDEESAGDYPEGRYELALQTAVEHDDQERLDSLLARRSRSQVIRLGLALLAVLVLGPGAIGLLIPPARRPTASTSPMVATLRLPPANECPRLNEREREKLSSLLGTFGSRLGADIPTGTSDGALTKAIAALDAALGTPDPDRNPGPLAELGPMQRQMRALLWKHSVADYDAPGANTVELLAKLETKIDHRK
jgi:hypothetical protein